MWNWKPPESFIFQKSIDVDLLDSLAIFHFKVWRANVIFIIFRISRMHVELISDFDIDTS